MGDYDLKQAEEALRRSLTGHGLARPRYAVVAPVVLGADGAALLIEVRAAGISQAGDPCFPGGRIEPGETPARAAARELSEELSICLDPARFLGRLPTVQTYLGRQTDIFVSILTQEEADAARPDPAEVAELLRVPLDFFLRRPDDASYRIGGHTVWGMTAGAIHHLCRAWQAALPLSDAGGGSPRQAPFRAHAVTEPLP